MNWRILLGLLLTITLSGCLAGSANLNPDEQKSFEAIHQVFEGRNFAILENLCTGRKIVAAEQHVEHFDEGEHYKGDGHDHDEEPGGGHSFVLIVRATPDESGNYLQPVLNLGNTKYYYEYLYTAEINDKMITINKSMATDTKADRQGKPCEREIIQALADRVGGTINGNSIMLP